MAGPGAEEAALFLGLDSSIDGSDDFFEPLDDGETNPVLLGYQIMIKFNKPINSLLISCYIINHSSFIYIHLERESEEMFYKLFKYL